MKKYFALPIFLSLFTLFSACQSLEERKGYSVSDVPNVRLQNPTHFVSDPDDYLTEEEERRINQEILQIQRETNVEIAVVILSDINHMQYADDRDFANRLFSEWGIGDKETDQGLLIFQNIKGRRYTFETGYGIEGKLPDAICKMIQVRKMIPYAKEGRMGQAMLAGVRGVHEVLTSDTEFQPAPMKQQQPQEKGRSFPFILVIIIILALFFKGPRNILFFLLGSFLGGRGGGFGSGGGFGGGGSWGGGSSGGGGASSGY